MLPLLLSAIGKQKQFFPLFPNTLSESFSESFCLSLSSLLDSKADRVKKKPWTEQSESDFHSVAVLLVKVGWDCSSWR